VGYFTKVCGPIIQVAERATRVKWTIFLFAPAVQFFGAPLAALPWRSTKSIAQFQLLTPGVITHFTTDFLHYDFEQTNMSNPTKSFGQKIIEGLSSLLLGAGGVVFFFGGKFLMQSRHMNFAEAEGYGIMGALLLVLLGVVVAIVGVKDPRTQNRS